MSTETSIGNPVVTRTVAGETIRFRKICVKERARLLREVLQPQIRAEVLENAKTAGLQKGEILGELERLGPCGEADWSAWLNRPDGKAAIVFSALQREYGPEADAQMEKLSLSYGAELELVAELANLEVVQQKAPPAATGQDVPLSYGQEGAGPRPTEAPETYAPPAK